MVLIREKKKGQKKVHTRIFVAVGQRYGDYDHLVCVIYDLYQPFILCGHKLYISGFCKNKRNKSRLQMH